MSTSDDHDRFTRRKSRPPISSVAHGSLGQATRALMPSLGQQAQPTHSRVALQGAKGERGLGVGAAREQGCEDEHEYESGAGHCRGNLSGVR